MERNEKNYPEQEAPLKNTDDAFVQVSEDGSPSMPANDKDRSEEKTSDKVTTTDKR